MSLAKQVTALNALIEQGQTMEAIERFYADEVEMQENDEVPRVGKAACLEQERKNTEKIPSVTAKLLRQVVDGEQQLVFSEWYFTFAGHQQQSSSLREVSVQQAEERYFVSDSTIMRYNKPNRLIQIPHL